MMEQAVLVQVYKAVSGYVKARRRSGALDRQKAAARRHERAMGSQLVSWRKETARLLRSKLGEVRSLKDVASLPWKRIEADGLKRLGPVMEAAYADSFGLAAKLRKQDEDEEPDFRADVIGQSAKAYVATQGAKMVVEIAEQQREAIRGVITTAIDAGWGPAKTGRVLRETVGLNSRLTAAAGNYYTKMLDQGVPEAKADSLLAKYANRLLTYRTNTIARTETLNALRTGTVASFKVYGIEKVEWIADPQCCEICAQYDGKTYTVEEVEDILNPHPNCECTIVMAAGEEPTEAAEAQTDERLWESLPEVTRENLAQVEEVALRHWQGGTYTHIKQWGRMSAAQQRASLREEAGQGLWTGVSEHYKTIQKMFGKFRPMHDVPLYRGIAPSPRDYERILKRAWTGHKMYLDRTMASFSTDVDVATGFAGGTNKIIFELKAGRTKGLELPVSKLGFSSEKEVIVQRQPFKVVGKRKEGRAMIITVEEIAEVQKQDEDVDTEIADIIAQAPDWKDARVDARAERRKKKAAAEEFDGRRTKH